MVGYTAPAKSQRFHTPYEVAQHCRPDDCWVSCMGHVLNLTQLVKDNEGPLAEPILREAGRDVSHWFDADTGDIKTHICPLTNVRKAYCPQGRFLHIAPAEPTTLWNCEYGLAWWMNPQFRIGQLSKRCRLVRIKNMLTQQEDTLEVPAEEVLSEIRTRYLSCNSHANAYIWKALVPDKEGNLDLQELDMNRTLSENGVPDDAEEFGRCNLEEDFYLPALHLYFTDDLTVA